MCTPLKRLSHYARILAASGGVNLLVDSLVILYAVALSYLYHLMAHPVKYIGKIAFSMTSWSDEDSQGVLKWISRTRRLSELQLNFNSLHICRANNWVGTVLVVLSSILLLNS